MNFKTNFILLLSTYAILVISSSINRPGTIGPSVVPFILMGALFLIYSVLSVTMTIKLSKSGGFDWISSSSQIRNIALVVGMLAILYALFNAIMIKAEWSSYQSQSISHPKDFMAFTGYIWVPLLMIIPYGLWVYKSDFMLHNSMALKVPIMINVFIGAATFMYFNFGFVKSIFTPRLSDTEYAYQQTLDRIQYEPKAMNLLYFTRPDYNDRKIVDAALSKIKSDPTWEYQITKALENCKNDQYFLELYYYLSAYKVENSDKLIGPFTQSIGCVAAMTSNMAANEYAAAGDLDALFIDKLLAAMAYQFSDKMPEITSKLTILEDALKNINREDFKDKTQSLLQEIQNFKDKFK